MGREDRVTLALRSLLVSVILIHMKPRETLDAFDRYLDGRDLVEVQDINPDWPAHVRATLADVGRRLRHGV
jgi:hypothetical protein